MPLEEALNTSGPGLVGRRVPVPHASAALVQRVRCVLALLAMLALAPAAQAAAPDVVVSIKPIYSLVAAVMQGVADPVLLVHGFASPHDYQLKPSDAAALEHADVVVRVGPRLERFLDRPLRSIARHARVVDLMDAPGLSLLPAREAGVFGESGSGDTGDATRRVDDPHVWLSPRAAVLMVDHLANVLVAVDPADALVYRNNANHTITRITRHDAEWSHALAGVQDVPFIVYHDAYQYLDHHFHLDAVGSITEDPDQPPSAMSLKLLRDKARAAGVKCVFREPQFDSPLVATVAQDIAARTAVLDPLGATIAPGPDAWFELMQGNVKSLLGCLGG